MAGVKSFGFVFLAFGGALLWLGLRLGNSLSGVIVLSAGAAFMGLGAGYVLGWPGLLGKTRRGTLLASSYFLFWPYHLLNYASIAAFRLVGVAPWHEIAPGLYLGGRLFPWEESRLKPLGITGVLDLTCEFSEVGFLRRSPAYFCIPLLDGGAPSQAELQAAIGFIRERLGVGPVYVHCAMGHGRSATVAAGYLLATGKATSVRGAVELVRSHRRGVRLRAEQWRSLEKLVA